MNKDILLIIDDAELNRTLLGRIFGRTYQIELAENGIDALEKMGSFKSRIAAVLLDLLMPDMDGFEVLAEMNQRGYLHQIPVVLISESDFNRTIQKGFELGAIDFIERPFQDEMVLHRVKNAIELFKHRARSEEIELLQYENFKYQEMFDMSSDIIFDYNCEEDTLHLSGGFKRIFDIDNVIEHTSERLWEMKLLEERMTDVFKQTVRALSPENPEFDTEIRLCKKSGRLVWYHVYVKSLWKYENQRHCKTLIGKLVDIDQLKSESTHWKDQAGRDALTRVNNRMAAKEMIYSSIREYPDETSAFIFLDVDDFKKVNDSYGHRIGDEVLMYISNKLQKVFRKSDIVWRIGGDEFAVFARNIPDRETIEKKLDELCEIYSKGYENHEISCEVSGSIGVALYPQDGQDYDTLMSRADKALYHAKRTGKNKYSFYDKTKM